MTPTTLRCALDTAVYRLQVLRDVLRVAAKPGIIQWIRAAKSIHAADTARAHALSLVVTETVYQFRDIACPGCRIVAGSV